MLFSRPYVVDVLNVLLVLMLLTVLVELELIELLLELLLVDTLLLFVLVVELLDDVLPELLETASSVLPTIMTSTVTSPPFAVNRIWWSLASVTSRPSASGLNSRIPPFCPSAPPFATVIVGIHGIGFAGAVTLISSFPPVVFWFAM
jgi:hypothetical protein